MKVVRYKIALLSLLSLPAMLLVATGGPAAAAPHASAAGAQPGAVTSSSLGTFKPTFAGPAATGCASGCHLLAGPFSTPSTAHLSASQAPGGLAKAPDRPMALPFRHPGVPVHGHGPAIRIPTVSCQPLGAGCDTISSLTGGATGVKGINAVDSATHTANIFKDIEPPDQGLCAGNGHVVETNNIGEILIFNKALKRVSPVISLDTVMGLTKRNWSSGGDPSCLYDSANGGHWFFSEFVSASPESKGGPFAGCFAAVANTCYEGIAVSKGSSPFGPYNVYFLNANYNPKEPGSPYQLNDYAKISATRDAFLLFYDEFPLRGNGIGGGFFNGAQEFAFDKNALEKGLPVTMPGGKPNPAVTVAIENMGLLKTPNGTCASDSKYHLPSIACWFSVIPALPPGPGQYDNSYGGSGFMLATLDFYNLGGNQLAAFDWTGLENLNSPGCSACGGLHFGGQLFSGVQRYYDNPGLPSGIPAPQKAGPIPLGNECGKAGLSVGKPPPAHCPQGGIATNSDQVTQASQAQGQLWAGVATALQQTYSSTNVPEQHMGAAYWVIGTRSFGDTGRLSLTSQGYVSAMHEDLEFPAMGAGASNGRAIMSFTLNGNGGEFVADNGGFYPSSAFGRLTSTSGGLLKSTVNIADLGQSPQDGFTEYQGYPSAPLSPRPRWGDYGAAIFLGGKVYFASEYIQYPNCAPPAFTLTVGTCGGTRNGNVNWGTSVNYVTP
jgi:hypothetical protein